MVEFCDVKGQPALLYFIIYAQCKLTPSHIAAAGVTTDTCLPYSLTSVFEEHAPILNIVVLAIFDLFVGIDYFTSWMARK